MSNCYRAYVLFILMLTYTFNFVDRQIITILAPYLKADLGISDAQLGLLYGTAFALFYGLFGIALAKLADGWSRVKTLALGLSVWSLMTTASGAASNFGQLGAARIGVGVGEASASPAAISLLGDYFRKEQRSTVIALYQTGAFVGAGLSLIIGGLIVSGWQSAYGDAVHAPFGLAGWQAAFIGVGLPGILLAVLILTTVREPVRGELEGQPHPGNPRPFRSALAEAGMMFPPWSVLHILRLGTSIDLRKNLTAIVAVITAIALTTLATDGLLSENRRSSLFEVGRLSITSNLVQWMAIGIAVYAAYSWTQSIRLRDPVAHRLIVGSPTFMGLTFACGFITISMYSVNAFIFLYASRYLGFSAADGFGLGAIAAIAGLMGTATGGLIGDWAKRWHPSGRIYVVMVTQTLFTVATAIQYVTPNVTLFYVTYSLATFLLPTYFGAITATVQDLALPRIRGIAYAVQTLGTSILGLGFGPYCVGLISDISGDLRMAILSILISMPCALLCLWFVARNLPEAERTLLDRARAAGESIS